MKTAHSGFLRGVASSGIYGFFAATTDIYYPFGDTRDGALGPTGVVATAEINGRPAAFMSRADGGGRWVLPIPLTGDNATSLTLTDSFTRDVAVTTLDLPATGAGAFLALPNIAAPYPPRGQSTAHIARLGHGWGVPVEFGVLSRTGSVFVAVDQDTFSANRASVQFEFPNPAVRSEFVGSETVIINGEQSILVQIPRRLRRGWSLGSNERPFVRMSMRAYRGGNDPVVTFPLVLDLALAIAPGDADGDGLDDVDEVFTCGSDPTQIDSDGDGFDDIEECATGRDGFDLRGAGALAYKRDIFIELDAMLASGHSDQLSSSAREQFAEVFEREGYQVHIDVGQDVGTGGPFTGGNPISHRSVLVDTCAGQSVINDFVAPIRAANFNETVRGRVFYYGLIAHFICGDMDRAAVAEAPGGTFVVKGGASVIAERVYALWMLHAIGHNMGLRHGGVRDCPSFKPNYNSVINPLWGTLLDPGIDTDCDPRNGGENALGFSHGQYLTLDERHLSEPPGVCGTKAVDWNGDGRTEADVAADTNPYFGDLFGNYALSCSDASVPSLDVLSDHDDWAALRLFTDVDRPILEPRAESF